MFSNSIIPFSRTGLIAAKTVYFFFTGMMCFGWFLYFEHLQGSAFVRSRKYVAASSCLLWILGVLLLINLFTGILFYVDETGKYCRGPLFIVQYLLAYPYVFAACGHALIGSFRKENLSHRRMLRRLAMFPIAPVGAGILQFTDPIIYPYFFLNPERVGIGGMAMWIFALLGAFVVGGFVFMLADKMLSGKKRM